MIFFSNINTSLIWNNLQFDLVCDDAYLNTILGVSWMISGGVGMLIGGAISDK